MSDDIRAGDVVAAIPGNECSLGHSGFELLFDTPDMVGDHFRVVKFGPVIRNKPTVILSGMPGKYCVGCFRKIDAADESLTRQIRALRPLKIREDA